MGESSLSIGWTELQQEVAFFLGYGRTLGNLSAAQLAEVAACVQAGVRQVYYPPAISPEMAGYEWSFLRPTKTLYLGASGTDGVISTNTFDSATYTDWVTQGITTADQVHITAPTANQGTYDISSVATGAITLTSSPGDATGLTFIVRRDPANYDLPDDFGRLIGDLHYSADSCRAAIQVVSINALLEMRAHEDRTDVPSFAAVRPKTSTGATGQRSEILFWPRPTSQAYTLSYTYEAYASILSDSYPYPLGGMHLAELYTESCLAVAERRINNEVGLHTQTFQTLLLDAVARDRKRGARIFGQMGHQESPFERIRHGDTGGTYPLTYDGVLI